MLSFMDELKVANNVYRTQEYIVTQEMSVRENEFDGPMIVSVDVFYKRTKERDTMYEKVFENRIHMDGRRIRGSMYSRRYID